VLWSLYMLRAKKRINITTITEITVLLFIYFYSLFLQFKLT